MGMVVDPYSGRWDSSYLLHLQQEIQAMRTHRHIITILTTTGLDCQASPSLGAFTFDTFSLWNTGTSINGDLSISHAQG